MGGRVTVMTDLPPEDPDADSDLPADSAAALRDAVEEGEDSDINDAERRDQIP